jgi:integrase
MREMSMTQRGIFEKFPGSAVWWIRYVDAQGRLRREKAGTKSAAILLYRKRKQEALEGRKLPEKLRRPPLPTLADFSRRFLDAIRIRCATKPRTIEFYAQQTRYLMAFKALADRQLDEVDEAAVEAFTQARRRQVGPATTNRGLAVLRRMLRLAHEWRMLDRVPRIHLLRGERNREFVLSRDQERIYLEFCPQILHDVAMLMLDTGRGPAEALGLQWTDIHREYLQVREGKTRYRARSVNLTSRVAAMLALRRHDSTSAFVFAAGSKKPLLPSSLAHLHARVRGEAQTACRVRVIFIKAHGVDPVRRERRRCFHHHANCWTFIGDHFAALCAPLIGDGGPGDCAAGHVEPAGPPAGGRRKRN